jgi:hypothetical protein
LEIVCSSTYFTYTLAFSTAVLLSPPVTVILIRVLTGALAGAEVFVESVFVAPVEFWAETTCAAVSKQQTFATASHRTTPTDILGRIFMG